MKWFRDEDFSWNGLRQPYRVFERHPDTVLVEPRLQVICFKSLCHPTWWPGYHDATVSHLNRPPGVAPLDWRNDTFAFLHNTDGTAVITDFNNTSAQDHIAVSASGFGGGLTPGMDVTSIFEASGDNQFSGGGAEFHFDTANQTLYFSANGTTAAEQALALVQAGVTIHPHDVLIV